MLYIVYLLDKDILLVFVKGEDIGMFFYIILWSSLVLSAYLVFRETYKNFKRKTEIDMDF